LRSAGGGGADSCLAAVKLGNEILFIQRETDLSLNEVSVRTPRLFSGRPAGEAIRAPFAVARCRRLNYSAERGDNRIKTKGQ
jgi:hypothetical protein